MTRALLLLLIGMCQPAAFAADTPAPQRTAPVANTWPLSDFSALDQHGRPITQDQVKGKWTFIVLGDTRCVKSCQGALRAVAGVFERIANAELAKSTRALFLSVDPRRDTPVSLHSFLAPYNDRIIGVAAAPATLKQLIEDLGMSERFPLSADAAPGGEARHAGTLLLMGPDGTVRAEFLPPFDVKRLTAAFLMIRVRG